MSNDHFDTVDMLGVSIDQITMIETLSVLEKWVGENNNRLKQICTVNPEFVMCARKDTQFLTVLKNADLRLADGIGLVVASRLYGKQLPERIAGSDLVYELARQCEQHGWRLFLLGAAEGVAELAAEKLRTLYPKIKIVGTFSGSPDPAEDEQLVSLVNASEADVLYVAFGAPNQDKWIARNQARLSSVKLAIGVGGSLDFISGTKKRAPRFFQRLGLEWLYRLWQEPWRWRRMVALPKFSCLALLEALSNSLWGLSF